MVNAKDFLDAIFADIGEDETLCVTKASVIRDNKTGKAKTLFWNLPDDHPVFIRWEPRNEAEAFYFCVSTVTGERNEKGTALRRRNKDLVRYHCLVLDDIGTKAEKPPVKPTWIIETSPGNFQYGFALYPGADFKRYEAILEWCFGKGWGDAGAGGAMRVVRLPGSANMKEGRDKFRSRVVSWHLDAVWDLDDLARDLGADASDIDNLMMAERPGVRGSATGQSVKENIDPMLTWLAAIGRVIDDGGGDFVKIQCPWHAEHTTGDDAAGYSPLGRGEGKWVMRRGFKCLHGHCLGRDFGTFSKWALSQKKGAPKVSGVDPIPWLQDRYVYIDRSMRVADLHQRPLGGNWLWSLDEWAYKHPGRVMVPGRDQPVSMKLAFIENEDTRTVVDTTYLPAPRDKDRAIVRGADDGQNRVNTYTSPNWPETDVEPNIFLKHVEFLLPEPEEYDLFLDWLAFKIQNPDRRSYGIIMIAEDTYGVGRTWLKTMLSRTLKGGVRTVTLAQLIGKGTSSDRTFNTWQVENQFLVVEEAKENTISREDFYNGYETFKLNVDPRVQPVTVNEKYGRMREGYMYYNALIFSNHSDAFSIPGNDRRICALTNPLTIQPQEYYDRLEMALDSHEPRRLYWWLMRQDLSHYDPIKPPMFPAKRAMIEQHRAPSDEIRTWIIENRDGGLFTRNSLRAAIVLAAVALDYPQFVTTPGKVHKPLWSKMGTLRQTEKGARYTLNGEQKEVRAIKDKKTWIAADKERDVKIIVKEVKKNPAS